MQINYCDLCGYPLHGKKYFLVVVTDDPKQTNYSRVPKAKEQYEIDESCYNLLVKIFDLKKSKIATVTKFLEDTYKLPVNRKTKSKSKGLKKY